MRRRGRAALAASAARRGAAFRLPAARRGGGARRAARRPGAAHGLPGRRRAGPGSASVSVRAAPAQLVGGVLLGQLAAALGAAALAPERLEIALPEAHLLDADAETLLLLSAIRDIGVGLVLDDFGAAHAALALLQRLPLTAVKLHRALVRDLPDDAEGAAIVRAIGTAAAALGLGVIAEGIDTEAQRAFLADCGCELGQGALFGRAMPAATLWDDQP